MDSLLIAGLALLAHLVISFWVYLKVTKGYNEDENSPELYLIDTLKNISIDEIMVIILINPVICTAGFITSFFIKLADVRK